MILLHLVLLRHRIKYSGESFTVDIKYIKFQNLFQLRTCPDQVTII